MPLEATAVRLNFGNLMLPKGKVKSLFEEQARALPPSRSTERAKICYYPVSIHTRYTRVKPWQGKVPVEVLLDFNVRGCLPCLSCCDAQSRSKSGINSLHSVQSALRNQQFNLEVSSI